MLSQVELEYVRGVLNAYYAKGYKYYLVHAVTEYDNENDVCIYLSKEEIRALNDNYFSVDHGLKLLINTSTRSNNNYGQRDTVDSYNGNVTIDVAEFIYTNAKNEYSLTSIPVNPNITEDYTDFKQTSILCFAVIALFLYIFIRDLFLRKG